MVDPTILPLRKRLTTLPTVPTPQTDQRSPQTGAPSARAKGFTCFHCGTNDTPLWRKGPNGPNTLCNACGTRWRRHGTVALRRPISTSTPESRAAAKRAKRTKPTRPATTTTISSTVVVVNNNEGPAAAARSRAREPRPRCVDCGTSMLSKERIQRIGQPVLCTQCESDRITSSRRSARLAMRNASISNGVFPNGSTRVATRSASTTIGDFPNGSSSHSSRAALSGGGYEVAPSYIASIPNGAIDIDTVIDEIQANSNEVEDNDGLITVGELDESTLAVYNQPPNRVPWAAPDLEISPNTCQITRKSSRPPTNTKVLPKPTSPSPIISKKKTSAKSKSDGRIRAANAIPGVEYICYSCDATETPLWRKGPLGKNTLCNACGTRWMRHGSTQPRPRPTHGELKTPIARKRKPPSVRRATPSPPYEEVILKDEAVEGREIPYLPPLHESIPGISLKRSTRSRRRTARGQSYFDSLADTDSQIEMDSIPLVLAIKQSGVGRMNTVGWGCGNGEVSGGGEAGIEGKMVNGVGLEANKLTDDKMDKLNALLQPQRNELFFNTT